MVIVLAPTFDDEEIRYEVGIVDIPSWLQSSVCKLPLGAIDVFLVRKRQFRNYETSGCPTYACDAGFIKRQVIETDLISTDEQADPSFYTNDWFDDIYENDEVEKFDWSEWWHY